MKCHVCIHDSRCSLKKTGEGDEIRDVSLRPFYAAFDHSLGNPTGNTSLEDDDFVKRFNLSLCRVENFGVLVTRHPRGLLVREFLEYFLIPIQDRLSEGLGLEFFPRGYAED